PSQELRACGIPAHLHRHGAPGLQPRSSPAQDSLRPRCIATGRAATAPLGSRGKPDKGDSNAGGGSEAAKMGHRGCRKDDAVKRQMDARKMGARKMLSVVMAAAVAVSPAIAGPALLFDPANGRILYAEDQDDQWFPASLTKIMTAYLVFEAIRD